MARVSPAPPGIPPAKCGKNDAITRPAVTSARRAARIGRVRPRPGGASRLLKVAAAPDRDRDERPGTDRPTPPGPTDPGLPEPAPTDPPGPPEPPREPGPPHRPHVQRELQPRSGLRAVGRGEEQGGRNERDREEQNRTGGNRTREDRTGGDRTDTGGTESGGQNRAGAGAAPAGAGGGRGQDLALSLVLPRMPGSPLRRCGHPDAWVPSAEVWAPGRLGPLCSGDALLYAWVPPAPCLSFPPQTPRWPQRGKG